MRPGMPPTKWRQLGDQDVNVPVADEPHMVDVETSKGQVRHFPFSLDREDAVSGVSVDGERWRPAGTVDWDDKCDMD